MTVVAIPPWTATGVIPPVDSTSPAAAERSPYVVNLGEFVLRFCTSQKRQQVLDGYLHYCARLHAAGLATGFQWLDGSFLEHVELLEGRPPNDLDVVTFFRLPAGVTESDVQQRAPDAFPLTRADRLAIKANFFVDPYFVNLDTPSELLVRHSTYWYSMWSHRRDASWRGYLQVDLSSSEDSTAAGHLTTPLPIGGTP